DRLIPLCRTANIPKPLLGLRRHAGQGSQSPFAVEEGIQIYERRLSESQYSPVERRALRSALSLWFVRRALVGVSRRNPAAVAGNLFRALRLSARTVVRFLLPHRFRQRYSLETWKLG